jgi:YebC/PmpR family DNA-binding regulatory protein
MSRHWNNIKLKKGILDKERSKGYTRVLRDITIAVKVGGADPDTNFRLKMALQKAKEINLPRDNYERAIKKALGEGAENYFDVNYEVYGVDGIAIYVEAATNNPTRTISNIRSYINKWEGSMGKEGCLQFVFERKAIFTLKDEGINVDDLTLELIDVGAEEVTQEDGFVTIKAEVEHYGPIQKKLDELKLKIEESGLEQVPLLTKAASNKENYQKVLKFVEALEGDDDVRKVYHNMEFNESFSA